MAKLFKTPFQPPEPDYSKYDHKKEQKKEQGYIEQLQQWLKQNGYNEPNTGKLVAFPIADGHAQYMVVSMKPLSLIHLPLGDAYQVSAATLRGLKNSDIEAQFREDRFWNDIHKGNESFLDKQPVGTILHYDNGFNQYVRQEVVKDKGKNKLKAIALVGEWRKHDLPIRNANGEIYYPYHAKHVVEGELSDRLNESTTYESPKFAKGQKIDPRNLPPINLEIPPMTAKQQNDAKLWKLIEQVKQTLEQGDDPLQRINAAKKQLLTVDAQGNFI